MMEIVELFFTPQLMYTVLEVESQEEVPHPSLSIDFVQRID